MNSQVHLKNITTYSLTHPQKRIWYIEKIYPNTSLYNIGGPVRIKGPVDLNLLEEAINILIKKNDGLRIKLIEQNGEVSQYVSEYKKTKLDFLNFAEFEAPEREFKKWVEIEATKPFIMENERLFYFALFKISYNDNGYLAKFHHIISDGWSVKIMTEQICSSYMKLLNGEEIDENADHSYIEYMDNEKQYLSSFRFLKNQSFWSEKFKVLPEIFLNKSSDIIQGKRKTFELDSELSLKIKKFTTDNKCSLNTFFVTLYLLYLNKTMQQEDIIIGIPVLNRSCKKEKSIFGMFASTMPFRFVLDDNHTVLETLIKVKEELMSYYYNQKYPYDLLMQELGLKKNGYDNLFNVCVNYYNTRLNLELKGSPIENVEFYNGNQIYSIQLVIKDWSDSGNLILDFDYKVNDYSDEQIGDMYMRLLNLMNQIIANPYLKVGKLSLLSEDERKKLLFAFNASEAEYPKGNVIYQLFEEQVEKTPDKVAVSFDKGQLNYRELNEKANQLARYLIKKGVKEEAVVGLLTIHSMETVIGILGIIKAGGAYLPIDPSYPGDRISYMLEDSGSTILLTNLELPGGVSFNGEIINLNNQSIYTGVASNPEAINKPNDLVYVIYTSGSTGNPKGTMIEHQGLVNYIWWAKKMYVTGEDEAFPLYSSLAFDLTVTSIFTPLVSGSKIIIYSDHNDEDEYALYRIMKENKATVIKLTPSHLSLLKDMVHGNSSVRRFIVGGEDLKASLAKDIHKSFGGKIEIFNEYGPTETVVGCMIHKYDYENDIRVSVPIGIPAANVQIYILDKNLNPVSLNTVGEMYISGDGVARGYLNRFELTQEKFIANPFIKGRRMYRTGDLARILSNGNAEYVRRADQQIKIRGYRIELGEIETCLLNHGAVKDAVIIDLENKNHGKYLCAYIVKKAEVSTSDLKSFLLRYLPDYMVPVYFIELDEIPLTLNGKINRGLLPEPEEETSEDLEFTTFRNEKEKILLNVICDVLNMERVSVKQNFYHIGGDSIKAIQIASKLNDKGLKIKVKDILSSPIIEEMSLYVEERNGLVINQQPSEGNIRCSPIMSWFFSQEFTNPNYYHQCVLLELKQDIEINKLEMILNKLIKHHDSLRINYNSQTGELFYNNRHLNNYYNIQEYDLTDLPSTTHINEMTRIAEDLKSSFNIENGILIKASLFNLGRDGKRLLITAHHLVVDGVSWRIILDDINTMIRQINSGQETILPAKTSSYQEWTNNMLKNYSKRALDEEKEYWKSVLSNDYRFPIDCDSDEDIAMSSYTIAAQISEGLTESLLKTANTSYNTEPKDLLLTSLFRTIKEFTGNEDMIVELEGHGREEIYESLDISRTVGWFTNMYPFFIKLSKDDLSGQIMEVKEEIRKVPNKGISFGILKYMLKAINDTHKKYIRFNYLGEFFTESENNSLKLLSDQIGPSSSKENKLTYIIEINCFIIDGKLNVFLTYSSNKFLENTLQGFLNSFIDNLTKIISFCCDKGTVEFTPSDFDTVDLSFEELENLFD